MLLPATARKGVSSAPIKSWTCHQHPRSFPPPPSAVSHPSDDNSHTRFTHKPARVCSSWSGQIHPACQPIVIIWWGVKESQFSGRMSWGRRRMDVGGGAHYSWTWSGHLASVVWPWDPGPERAMCSTQQMLVLLCRHESRDRCLLIHVT